MNVYLQHPIHGVKIANSDMEVSQDVRNGWKVFDPTAAAKPEPIVQESVAPQQEFEVGNALEIKRRVRRPREA